MEIELPSCENSSQIQPCACLRLAASASPSGAACLRSLGVTPASLPPPQP
jgi:hypothetical protein